ncbi:MAG: FHA domain-containing protein [Woeseiaceae bacterium]
MPSHGKTLASKAFGEFAEDALIVAYESHADALRFLSSALQQPNGIALLNGPRGSGKSTIVKEQRAWSMRETAVALVDGANLTPRQFLQSVLSQFGVAPVPLHDEQMLQAANKFASQQKRTGQAPIVIVDNVDRASPSTLRLLNWLAALDVQGGFALRFVLSAEERFSLLFRDDSTRSIIRRNPSTFSLNPLSARETVRYLRTRWIAAGGDRAEEIFSRDVCEQLHEQALGWPGQLNKLAYEVALEATPVIEPKPRPRIIITCDGTTIAERELKEKQYVIGRGDLADIVIEDSYASKIHAMLKIYSNALVLIDLNSTNGTMVNSKEVYKTILRSDDIIMLGRHRLKIENAPVIGAEMDARIRASDTLTLKHLDDIRRTRAQHTIAALKHK